MKSYFFKIPYGDEGKSRWAFGRFENKNEVMASQSGKAFEILTIKQLFEKNSEEEIVKIAKNCLVYQPAAMGDFPEDVQKLLE